MHVAASGSAANSLPHYLEHEQMKGVVTQVHIKPPRTELVPNSSLYEGLILLVIVPQGLNWIASRK